MERHHKFLIATGIVATGVFTLAYFGSEPAVSTPKPDTRWSIGPGTVWQVIIENESSYTIVMERDDHKTYAFRVCGKPYSLWRGAHGILEMDDCDLKDFIHLPPDYVYSTNQKETK